MGRISYELGKLDAIAFIKNDAVRSARQNVRSQRVKLNQGKCPKGKHWVRPSSGKRGFCRKGGDGSASLHSGYDDNKYLEDMISRGDLDPNKKYTKQELRNHFVKNIEYGSKDEIRQINGMSPQERAKLPPEIKKAYNHWRTNVLPENEKYIAQQREMQRQYWQEREERKKHWWDPYRILH